ncbi:uncharacterized protein cubi_02162 [Cryptosporidium ubiquitum]|uniref:Magnesium transporter n=1 Tax=Cryptosporidium ubiquitum TaxID=857276 RepID=A0A1J4MHJ4_9CRYT|nr:uncharacterized protein cubi_02162 [Cryptosporidium ubiquitum]OII72931.1 hypothetical protein cubi_02162 [Cryptosporidium ubiquitum]
MWYFGIFTALLSSILGGLGDNLIRLSFILEEELCPKKKRPIVLRPIWLLGVFFSCILNAILIIISLNFASAMIVTPFSGLHIFWSIIFSKYMLNEEIKSRHYKGTGLVIAGLLIIILFGIKDVPVYSVEELSILYTKPKFILYCLSNISFILVCTYLSFFGLDGNEEIKYKNELGLSNTNNCGNIKNDNRNFFNNTEKDNNSNNVNRKSSQDIIILNKNTLHLKISNIKDYLTKNKYFKYDKSIPDMDNSDNNIIETLNIPSNHIVNETCMNSNSNIKYGFGREDNTTEDFKEGLYNKMVNYINIIEKRFEVINSIFFELTKKFPRIEISTAIKRFCICSVSGLVGGYTNVLVQNLIQIILIDGIYVLFHRLTYQLLFIIFITGSIQWAFWNTALSKFQAIFVVPIVNSVLIASSGFCNLMLYYDKQYISNSILGLFFQINFLFGQFLIVLGIYIISRANRNVTNENNELNNVNESANSFNEDDIFDFTETSQKPDPNNNKLSLYLQSKFSYFSEITHFFKVKKEKINSSLESLLGLSRNQNLSNNYSNPSLPNTKYLNNISQFHIDNTIILPQEEYNDNQLACIHVDNNQAAITNTGIEEEKCHIDMEDNYTSFNDSILNNQLIEGNRQEDMDFVSQQILVSANTEYSSSILNQLEDVTGNEYHKRCGIELESYVLDEYDIDDFEIPFSNQDYTSKGALMVQQTTQYQDYVNEQMNNHSILSFGDDILEENNTKNYYQGDLMNTGEIEYTEDFNNNNNYYNDVNSNNINNNSDFTYNLNNENHSVAHDSKFDCNPSLSTCSTNSTMLNSIITNVL